MVLILCYPTKYYHLNDTSMPPVGTPSMRSVSNYRSVHNCNYAYY